VWALLNDSMAVIEHLGTPSTVTLRRLPGESRRPKWISVLRRTLHLASAGSRVCNRLYYSNRKDKSAVPRLAVARLLPSNHCRRDLVDSARCEDPPILDVSRCRMQTRWRPSAKGDGRSQRAAPLRRVRPAQHSRLSPSSKFSFAGTQTVPKPNCSGIVTCVVSICRLFKNPLIRVVLLFPPSEQRLAINRRTMSRRTPEIHRPLAPKRPTGLLPTPPPPANWLLIASAAATEQIRSDEDGIEERDQTGPLVVHCTRYDGARRLTGDRQPNVTRVRGRRSSSVSLCFGVSTIFQIWLPARTDR